MCSIESKIATIYSLKDIEEKAQNNPYLVLFAYKKESYNNAKDRHLKQTIDRIENSLEKLANRKEYLMTGVRFAKTKADTSFWQHLMEKVGTDQTEETMCFIIFEEGIIIKKNNLPACLLGKHGLVDIKEFIENYLGDQIAQTMKNMNAEKQKYQEKQEEDYADDRSSTSINVYYPSYYDPYYYHWGYPWYSYGPGWGYGRWRGYRSHHHHGWHGRGSRHRR
ncbi:hypothetical protein EKK58_04555 [Candidatus Dependentiae bacterium]|nr:MAG: hypothetical protein EKK58_04555 [Candidatus Dependentiae bacterium]